MHKAPFEIINYTDNYRTQVLSVWEQSTRATHDFLKAEDFEFIKTLVNTMDFNILQVFCLVKDQVVAGFIALADKKIEALFLDPQYIGQGLGLKLLKFAVDTLGADKIDVNEQNTHALAFYQKFGFEIFERSATDEQGKPYPILKMQLAKKEVCPKSH